MGLIKSLVPNSINHFRPIFPSFFFGTRVEYLVYCFCSNFFLASLASFFIWPCLQEFIPAVHFLSSETFPGVCELCHLIPSPQCFHETSCFHHKHHLERSLPDRAFCAATPDSPKQKAHMPRSQSQCQCWENKRPGDFFHLKTGTQISFS